MSNHKARYCKHFLQLPSYALWNHTIVTQSIIYLFHIMYHVPSITFFVPSITPCCSEKSVRSSQLFIFLLKRYGDGVLHIEKWWLYINFFWHKQEINLVFCPKHNVSGLNLTHLRFVAIPEKIYVSSKGLSLLPWYTNPIPK